MKRVLNIVWLRMVLYIVNITRKMFYKHMCDWVIFAGCMLKYVCWLDWAETFPRKTYAMGIQTRIWVVSWKSKSKHFQKSFVCRWVFIVKHSYKYKWQNYSQTHLSSLIYTSKAVDCASIWHLRRKVYTAHLRTYSFLLRSRSLRNSFC